MLIFFPDFLPAMQSRSIGHVVFVSNILGHIALPDFSSVSASHHALRAFADTFRAEVSPDGIKVTVASLATHANVKHSHIIDGSGKLLRKLSMLINVFIDNISTLF
jgi:NADP-dependent 3-hydroxy acid dehydrogenase YdfG